MVMKRPKRRHKVTHELLKPVSLGKMKNRDPYQRIQSRLKFSNVFPKLKKKGKCRCGCRKKVVAPKRYWATTQCSTAASEYYSVIKGYQSVIRALLYHRDVGTCASCARDCGRRNWDADHVLEVVRGGGGCDLSNFQTLCKECHEEKTTVLRLELKQERMSGRVV